MGSMAQMGSTAQSDPRARLGLQERLAPPAQMGSTAQPDPPVRLGLQERLAPPAQMGSTAQPDPPARPGPLDRKVQLDLRDPRGLLDRLAGQRQTRSSLAT